MLLPDAVLPNDHHLWVHCSLTDVSLLSLLLCRFDLFCCPFPRFSPLLSALFQLNFQHAVFSEQFIEQSAVIYRHICWAHSFTHSVIGQRHHNRGRRRKRGKKYRSVRWECSLIDYHSEKLKDFFSAQKYSLEADRLDAVADDRKWGEKKAVKMSTFFHCSSIFGVIAG